MSETLAEALWAAEKAAADPMQQAIAYGATYAEDGQQFAYDILAAAALAWVAERLAAEETREAVEAAVGKRLRHVGGGSVEVLAHDFTDAALAAVRGELLGEAGE